MMDKSENEACSYKEVARLRILELAADFSISDDEALALVRQLNAVMTAYDEG